ncbi:MAG: DUF2231 domain-containing protein [Ignavibacteriaceae bacterium]
MEFLAQLHPKIVHFPIALLSVYVLLEITGVIFKKDLFSKTAHLILLLGVLGALAAVLTGNQAEDVAHLWHKLGANINLDAIENHSDYANITLWYFAGLLVLRTFVVLNKKFTGYLKYIFVVLSLLGLFFIYQTGNYGGKLVYDYGVGTQLKKMEIKK